MAPKLHLYMSTGACSLAPHIALQESGLEFTTTDLGAKRGYPAEHLHLNPKGRVPILDLDGERITETPAILGVISALAPEKKLLGSTLLERARAQEWLAWLCGTLHGQGFGALFRPARFVGDKEELYDVIKAIGLQCVKNSFAYINEKLEGKPFAVGDAFTAVDAYLYVFYRWGNMLRLGMKENYPNYARLVDEVVKLDSVRKAVDAEGISFDGTL
ncbi:glutathione S-transferase [Ophiobolus disseminans]|uniref:Glutathione S-transferase n=1 Tax=Ophiobolus disseminans TaxID=1469910 RepID=A0A6A6ZP62_9PLEO|nr:glutathione S-transferase [Ophiobolus disseminans]